jgi:hypothetical protein
VTIVEIFKFSKLEMLMVAQSISLSAVAIAAILLLVAAIS